MGKGKQKKREKLTREQATALIMGVFGRNPGQIYNYKQISKILFLSDKNSRAVVSRTLDELVDKKQLEQLEPGRYRLLSRAGYKTGTIDMTYHGYAYLVSEGNGDDVFIARNNLKTALDGDLVRVFVYPRRKQRTRIEGEVVEMLARARDYCGAEEVRFEASRIAPGVR